MTPLTFRRFVILAALMIVLGVVSLGALLAAEPEVTYKVPAGNDVAALFDFIQQLQSYEPKTLQEFSDHEAKATPAIQAAATKILKLEKDPKSENAKKAAGILLELRVDKIAGASADEQAATLDALKQSLAGRPLTGADVNLAMTLASNLEMAGQTELAAEAYRDFAKLFGESANERIAKAAGRFTGAARRLSLIGKPLELTGTTLDGKKFDWSKYRGKVVLVDFWATWCGPCREEIPNMKANYAKYHAQGFDVVGISVDEDRDALDKFLTTEKIPWVTLNEQPDEEGNRAMVDYYGIMGYPTTMLVGRDGKVVALEVRGEDLGKELARLLSKPATK